MKCICFLLCLCFGLTLMAEDQFVTVYRNGGELLIQSSYSQQEDLVIRVRWIANEESYLIPRNSDLRNFASGRRLHSNSDEYPATKFVSYNFLSGNHGSPFGRYLKIPGHTFTEADIGGIITDENQRKLVIIQITDKDQILVHPEPVNNAPLGRAKFFHLNKEKLSYKGKELNYLSATMGQVRPLNRITRNEFLADGARPLPNRTIVRCRFVDHIFIHDVIVPEAVVEYVKKHPGKKMDPEFIGKWKMQHVTDDPSMEWFKKLPAMMNVSNRFRYQPWGCMVNYRTTKILLPVEGLTQMEANFGWGGGLISPRKNEFFYVPKVKKLMLKHRHTGKEEYSCDLAANYRMPENMQVDYTINRLRDSVNPENPPDRFIRTTGDDKIEFGIALGYSMINGCTALENKGANRSEIFYLYHTKKMYPQCYSLENPAPGTTMHSVSYKQYFNPAAEPDATSFYYHWENDSLLVYFDTHKSLKNKLLQLPGWCTGKKVTVVEKTPSVELASDYKLVPESGIRFNVKDNYGYLVLKLD